MLHEGYLLQFFSCFLRMFLHTLLQLSYFFKAHSALSSKYQLIFVNMFHFSFFTPVFKSFIASFPNPCYKVTLSSSFFVEELFHYHHFPKEIIKYINLVLLNHFLNKKGQVASTNCLKMLNYSNHTGGTRTVHRLGTGSQPAN